jgi:orotidine-5'-phosphate decarboxylase
MHALSNRIPASESFHPKNSFQNLEPRERLIVALDVSTAAAAQKIVAAVGQSALTFKVGMQLYTAEGPSVVRDLVASGRRVFLDLKYHDIPNTVAGAVLSAAALPNVQLVNVHALGGTAMLKAASQAVSAGVPMGADRTRLLAVTLLTSMDAKTVKEVGIGGPPQSRVTKLAKLAQSAGVDGVVASVHEAKAVRKACGRDFLIVTPGVRPKDGDGEQKKDDQARTATPREAIKAGADYIVVGRPILTAADPRKTAQEIVDEIAAAK